MKETILQYFTDMIAQEEVPSEDFYINRKLFKNTKDDFPSSVQEAYAFYLENVEYADWGSASLYQIEIESIEDEVFAIHTTTDGDDGWLEIYDIEGTNLGYGRFYLTKIVFKGIEVREQVMKGGLPEELTSDLV